MKYEVKASQTNLIECQYFQSVHRCGKRIRRNKNHRLTSKSEEEFERKATKNSFATVAAHNGSQNRESLPMKSLVMNRFIILHRHRTNF